EDLLGEIFSRAFFPQHPLGLSIAGTPKTVRTFGSEAARKYHRKMFRPENIVVVAAGHVKHEKILELSNSMLLSTQSPRRSQSKADTTSPAVKKRRQRKTLAPQMAAPILVKQNRNLEQAHLIIATPFVSGRDKRRYEADILTQIIGGGMSSRLWQKIREERGLAYSVGAGSIMFNDCGIFTVSAATSPQQTLDVLDITIAEMSNIVEHGVTADELALAKEQTRVSVLMSLEDSASRAASLAQSEMLHGRQITLEESLANVNAVTLDDVRNIAREFFKTEKIAFAALGNLNGVKINRKRLTISV
ncbi:MAG: pitrilysin family protein, partial [Pyrinomonadaceae bacterium]